MPLADRRACRTDGALPPGLVTLSAAGSAMLVTGGGTVPMTGGGPTMTGTIGHLGERGRCGRPLPAGLLSPAVGPCAPLLLPIAGFFRSSFLPPGLMRPAEPPLPPLPIEKCPPLPRPKPAASAAVANAIAAVITTNASG